MPTEDPYVRKLVSLCDMHRVSFGSPSNLAGFMGALEENKHLAMDFWAMVARMTEEEGGDSGSARILEAIVQSVTGGSVADARRAGGEESRLVGELASLLAGEDVHRPAVVESAAVAKADAVVEGDVAEVPSPVAAAVPLPAEGAAPPPPLRAEPELLLQNRQDGRGENRRIVLQPEPEALPPVAKSPFLKVSFAKEEERDVPIPLAAYAERNPEPRGRTVGVVLVLAMLVGAGGFAVQRYGPGWWERYGPTARALVGVKDRGESASAASPVAATPAPSSAVASVSSPSGDDGQVGAGATALRRGVVPPAPRAAMRQQTRPESPQPAAPIVRPPAPVARAQVESEAVARARRRVVEEDDDSVANETGPGAPVTVGPAAMEANLISSRVPAYPEAAKARGLEGRVVMQAIVSKSGMVGHLRVISGDPMLRSAAAEAVSTWRYRPYLVNGQPVDVSTLVSVDFKLNR